MCARPKSDYKIDYCPPCLLFKPQGFSSDQIVEITAEEAEALRLKNIKNLDQTEAAKKMNISQSTFQRILTSAYKKVSEALILGKEIIIKNK